MKTYFLTLTVAALGAALVERLSPQGEGGRLAGYTRLIAGLYLLVVLLSPLRDGIKVLSGLAQGQDDVIGELEEAISRPTGDYGDVFAEQLTQLGAREAEAYVYDTLSRQFHIHDGTYVEAVYAGKENGEMTPIELRIALSGVAALHDPVPIEDYFSEAFGCPCYVSVKP
ncbi:MAG: hypothetical protein IIV80_01290 [Clostridia bacterium]|nr:hypothetical protein [Clostridia bacterium]MBQ5724765.1 hypothetical protein [Clostridia bacterium]